LARQKQKQRRQERLRSVDQLINAKKQRQKRPQSIGQVKARKAGEATVYQLVDRWIDQIHTKKAEEVAVNWPGNRSNGQSISTKTKQQQQAKKTEHETDGLSTKANQRFFFFRRSDEVALAHRIWYCTYLRYLVHVVHYVPGTKYSEYLIYRI